MKTARTTWTDERLDDLSVRVSDLSRRVDDGFARVDARFDALHRLLIQLAAGAGVGLLIGVATTVVSVLLTRGG